MKEENKDDKKEVKGFARDEVSCMLCSKNWKNDKHLVLNAWKEPICTKCLGARAQARTYDEIFVKEVI